MPAPARVPLRRCQSAPPIALDEVDWLFHTRYDCRDALYMDPRYLARFSTVRTYHSAHNRAMMEVDDKILKVLPMLVDVGVIVANMDLARKKVPVPRVFDYGYSGNCSFILMEKIAPSINAARYMSLGKYDTLPHKFKRSV